MILFDGQSGVFGRLENDRGGSFELALLIVTQGDRFDTTDLRLEEFLLVSHVYMQVLNEIMNAAK